MAIELNFPSWKDQMEAALRALPDVRAARIVAEGAVIREIHVLTGRSRGPKRVVRDVQTLLTTRLGREIDHRTISVAQVDADEPAAPPPPRLGPVAAALPELTARSAEPLAAEAPVAPAAYPRLAPRRAPARIATQADALESGRRIRFGSVNLYVSGPRAHAQVELRWKGISRMGSAAGTATRVGASSLVASATVAAIQEFLEDGWGLSVTGVEFPRLGRHEVAVVGLVLLTHRQEKVLVGSCTVEQDPHQAVVLATLDALNRVVGGLPTREPTEYVLRPTSTQEDSEAR